MDDESLEITTAGIGYEGRSAVPTQNLQISGGNFASAGRDVHNHTHIHEAPKLDLLSMLDSIDNFRQIQQDTLSKATPKTGEWVFEFEVFPIWLEPEGVIKTLWGSGIPGAGKTVLTSIMVNGVEKWAEEQASPICVCYIYIRYSDNAGLTVRHCLEVLVKQTIEKHPSCLQRAQEVYAEHIRLKTRPTEDELFQLLKIFTTRVKVTFYFLDALDEAPARIQFELLARLTSLNVKLFITSRPLKILEAEVPDAHHFTIAARDHDLDLHINKEIQRSPHLRRLLDKGDPSWRATVISTVKEKCGGMFLHASLQMAALQECSSVCDVNETLEQFPADIEDVYLQTWNRILDKPSKNSLLAKRCITWVLYAARSLKVEELRYAVATDPVTHSFDDARLVDEDTLVAPCRGLLVVDEETRLVRLVHYTAKDTLERLILKTLPSPQSLLTSVCIVRLIGRGFQDWKDDSPFGFSNALEGEPFLGYAYDSWPAHAQMSLEDTPTTLQLAQFVRGCHAYPVRDGLFDFNLLGPLHLVAFFDLPIELAGFSPMLDQDPNPLTAKGETPLHIACENNSLNTLKELLRLPLILVNVLNERGVSPLMVAAENGHKTAIKLLLDHTELDINAENGSQGESVLALAARRGFADIVALLLAHSLINVNVLDMEGQTPLVAAVKGGQMVTAELLLIHPQVEVNFVDENGWTPLAWAAKVGLEALLKPLLAHPQIDVNMADMQGLTPLHWASREGHTTSVEILLEHSQVDANSADEDGSTPLVWVLKGNQPESLLARIGLRATPFEPLLANPQIDVNLADKAGWTPLIWAAKQGSSTVLKALLAHPKININLADRRGRTPLIWALVEAQAAVVELLLAHPQVDVNLADKEGRTPLIWAVKDNPSRDGFWGFFTKRPFNDILQHPQVDVNAADNQGETALVWALRLGHMPSVNGLLAHPNVNPNTADNEGRTPLVWAREEGLEEAVNLILMHSSFNPNPDPSFTSSRDPHPSLIPDRTPAPRSGSSSLPLLDAPPEQEVESNDETEASTVRLRQASSGDRSHSLVLTVNDTTAAEADQVPRGRRRRILENASKMARRVWRK